jgi:hypothetical protein
MHIAPIPATFIEKRKLKATQAHWMAYL